MILHSKLKFAGNLLIVVLACFLTEIILLPVLIVLRWVGAVGPVFQWRSDFINTEDFPVPDEVFS